RVRLDEGPRKEAGFRRGSRTRLLEGTKQAEHDLRGGALLTGWTGEAGGISAQSREGRIPGHDTESRGRRPRRISWSAPIRRNDCWQRDTLLQQRYPTSQEGPRTGRDPLRSQVHG